MDGDGRNELIAGAESAYVFAFDHDGAVRWRRNLGDAVSRVALLPQTDVPPRFAIVAGHAGVIVLGANGDVKANWRDESPVVDLTVVGPSRIAASLPGGRVVGIEVGR